MVTITRENEETLLWLEGGSSVALTLSDLEHLAERIDFVLDQMESEPYRGEF